MPSLRSPQLFAPFLLAGLLAGGAARADQDDDAERVPSNAAEIYSPIARTFTRQPALPGGPRRRRAHPQESLPPPAGPVLFEDLKRRLQHTDPFFRDAVVDVYVRSYYLDRHNIDATRSQAWAGGSALAVRSGFHDGWLQLEGAVATSQPIYAPDGEGGTLLLTDQQAEVSSFALANARIRLPEQEIVLGRQLIKTPYLNPQDTRMIPNTFEGAVIERRRDRTGKLDYGAGYLWGFKARDSSRFVSFSEELGLVEDRGLLVAGAKLTPAKGLTFGAIEYFIPDTLNTVYGEIDWVGAPFGEALQFHLALNYTDQRTIGVPFGVGRTPATHQVSALAAASYQSTTLLLAASANGSGSDIIGPFGSFPAYTVMDQLNYNDAGVSAVVVGAAYDFSRVITDGLKAEVRYGAGWGVVDPLTGAALPRQNELDLQLEYGPKSGHLKDFYLQLFYSGVKLPGAKPDDTQPQVRAVLTYLLPLL